ncbi:MAG TPA: 50S ribosomal protein L4 [Candidatus Protoclostridium stercorigallinarum]|uniref:Large ribosomal subunit protein uL4 n=1 Tax=Candidatus Protoclostridium stercorigallinarum TaxID=2838741 RepID=A0A9D1TSL1_9FIRM|nr:50S ribosomal protein L4 [Candidatus Protoclostridium stercorigallinarum]
MPNVKLYKQTGEEAGTVTLDDAVFGAERNPAVIHQVVVAQLANKRQGTKSALTRAEVAGGGRKPWRQKGTGNARQGSIRAPQWKHGGVVFAPKPRDFSQKINKKMKDVAFRSAISSKVSDDQLKVVDEIKVGGKTKEMAAVIKALGLTKRTLLVLTAGDELVVRAAGNLEKVDTVKAEVVSVLDLMNHTDVVLTQAAAKQIEEAYKA